MLSQCRIKFHVLFTFAATLLTMAAYAQGPIPEDNYSKSQLNSDAGAQPIHVHDPLEPVNRVFFQFNDKLYFWILKPVARGYKTVVPHTARTGVDNFFDNLKMPVRAVNCTLQGDLDGTSAELTRFLINSTWGVAGVMDPARHHCQIKPRPEDTGQTFGRYGAGSGFFINWPVLGPSNLRDSVGRIGDMLLNPFTYLRDPAGLRYALRGTERINSTSLRLGEYEEFKEGALDAYISLRNAYEQYRRSAIRR